MADPIPTPSFRELLQAMGPIAMLTSTTVLGRLESRPMVLQEADERSDLWFFTSRGLPWVAALAEMPAVNVAFMSTVDDSYLSIAGRAEVVFDPAHAARLWDDAYRTWFPKGRDDPDLVLLRVIGEHAQAWVGGTHHEPLIIPPRRG